ncbi:hypothetical protein [Cupriavidus campinensis]|uniref:hypothetical protein n=1 Tax=Cupriavidus campinensis TaxID=151783 RepID=UPI00292A3BDE|nr:hypothetical protein [Cupriavidus campinensis]
MQRTHKTHILKKFAAASAMVVVAGAAFAQATTPAPAPTTPRQRKAPKAARAATWRVATAAPATTMAACG